MSTTRIRRLAAVALALGLAVGACSTEGEGGDDDASRPAATDPMYEVSDNARFTSDGDERDGWHWLEQADQTARWEFTGLPDDLTDLVVQLRAAVPDDAESGDFYFAFGTEVDGKDRRIGVARAALPLDAAVEGRTRLARTNLTIPEAAIPEGTTSLWVETSRTDPAGDEPDVDTTVAFRKESVRFSPLRAEASDDEPRADDEPLPGDTPLPGQTTTTTPVRDGDETVDETTTATAPAPAPTPAPSPVPPPPTTPPPAGPAFTVDGDEINGWWWLRDPAGTQSAQWLLALPGTTPSEGGGSPSSAVRIDFEVLATSQASGPPGVDARFHLSWGPVVDGAPGPLVSSRPVTLENVDAPGDSPGYTNRGSVTIRRSALGTATWMWVRITRVDESGGNLTSEHVAVRSSSVTLAGGGATTTTTTPGTTSPPTTSPSSTTEPATSSTTEPVDTTVASCDVGATVGRTFAPGPTAARWYRTQAGRGYAVLRSSGDSVSRAMPEDYTRPINQHATWTFNKLPAGAGDVRLRFNVRYRVSPPFGTPRDTQELYVTYGATPAPETGRVRGPVTATLTKLDLPAMQLPTGALPNQAIMARHWEDYYVYRGEITVPRSEVTGDAGFWVRGSLYDLSTDSTWGAQAAVDLGSMEMCAGGRPPVTRPGQPSTPDVTVTLDPATRALTTDGSFLIDPGTDVDGDGLNQTFEDAAAAELNPLLEFDEHEDFTVQRAQLPAMTLVHVRPWPTYQDVQQVIFEFVPTFAVDGGVGITFTDWNDDWVRLGIEPHRGDSEKVFLAYDVVDDEHLTFTRAFTSAHHSQTLHDGLWNPTGDRCTPAYLAVLDLGNASFTTETEQMCGALEFDQDGRLIVYPSRNKHAMYPSKATCEAATLAKLRVTATEWAPWTWTLYPWSIITGEEAEVAFTETCGYDPLFSETFDDDRYMGDGRWKLDLFNVGEPGNWMIDDLDTPSSWRGLTTDQVQALTGKYPNEGIWTGRPNTTEEGGHEFAYCGGLDTEMGDNSFPQACAGRIGSKFDAPPSLLLDHLTENGG